MAHACRQSECAIVKVAVSVAVSVGVGVEAVSQSACAAAGTGLAGSCFWATGTGTGYDVYAAKQLPRSAQDQFVAKRRVCQNFERSAERPKKTEI